MHTSTSSVFRYVWGNNTSHSGTSTEWRRYRLSAGTRNLLHVNDYTNVLRMFSLAMIIIIQLLILSENITCTCSSSICEQFSLSLLSGVICMCIWNKTRLFDIDVLFIQLTTHTHTPKYTDTSLRAASLVRLLATRLYFWVPNKWKSVHRIKCSRRVVSVRITSEVHTSYYC